MVLHLYEKQTLLPCSMSFCCGSKNYLWRRTKYWLTIYDYLLYRPCFSTSLASICFTRLPGMRAQPFPGWQYPFPGHVAVPCHHQDGSQLKAVQTGQEFVRRASGKASAVAALLLPSTTRWGQRERKPWPADTWRQTHRLGITKFAGAALLPWTQQPNIQLAWPWVRSQQNGIKSHPPQNIIMACKMRRAKEDVCCISCGKYRLHVWPGFIRVLAETMTQNSFTSLFGFSHLKTGRTLVSET